MRTKIYATPGLGGSLLFVATFDVFRVQRCASARPTFPRLPLPTQNSTHSAASRAASAPHAQHLVRLGHLGPTTKRWRLLRQELPAAAPAQGPRTAAPQEGHGLGRPRAVPSPSAHVPLRARARNPRGLEAAGSRVTRGGRDRTLSHPL